MKYVFENNERYIRYSTSFITLLEFSLGGFYKIFETAENGKISDFSVLFITFFVFIMLYEIHSFFPFYTERFRILTLKYDAPYSKRLKNKVNKERPETGSEISGSVEIASAIGSGSASVFLK